MTYEPDDQELVGKRWPPGKIDELTDLERARLTAYWHETSGFEDQAEELLASPGPLDRVAASKLLDQWEPLWAQLRDWHHKMNHAGEGHDSNPVSKRLKYDSSLIGTLRGSMRDL